jgi:hypothetical protein
MERVDVRVDVTLIGCVSGVKSRAGRLEGSFSTQPRGLSVVDRGR